MSRIKAITPEQATGQTAELYSAIKSQLGGVPNIFQALGAQPKVLAAFLGLGPAQTSLTAIEKESIALAVAQANSCNYCLAADSVLGKKVGLSESDTVAARKGGATNPKTDALIKLAREITTERGHVSEGAYQAFLSAGYSDSVLAEVVLAVVQNIFTNYFNHANQTDVDFPAAAKI